MTKGREFSVATGIHESTRGPIAAHHARSGTIKRREIQVAERRGEIDCHTADKLRKPVARSHRIPGRWHPHPRGFDVEGKSGSAANQRAHKDTSLARPPRQAAWRPQKRSSASLKWPSVSSSRSIAWSQGPLAARSTRSCPPVPKASCSSIDQTPQSLACNDIPLQPDESQRSLSQIPREAQRSCRRTSSARPHARTDSCYEPTRSVAGVQHEEPGPVIERCGTWRNSGKLGDPQILSSIEPDATRYSRNPAK
jgi:hypothetical protein